MDTLAKLRRPAGGSEFRRHGRPPPSRNREAKKSVAPREGEIVTTRDGRALLLRSIHADDVDALRRGFSHLTAEEVRLRFLHPMTELPEAFARALCDIDPKVAIALVLVDPMNRGPSATDRSPSKPEAMDDLEGPAKAIDGREPPTETLHDPVAPPGAEAVIHAVARAYIDPVTLAAEFALVVQHRYAGQGLGTLLMKRLIAACCAHGAVEIWGDVLAENGAMLELCDHLGFSRHSAYHDPGVVRVTLPLA